MNKVLLSNIENLKIVFDLMKEDTFFLNAFNKATEAISLSLKSGGRIYFAGNGGSAADSQHIAAEFISRLSNDRAPLCAEALTTDTSVLTAIGNDYGFEYVYSRQLEAKLRVGDIFIGITTSGNSKNILNAFKACNRIQVSSILITGNMGGVAKFLADYAMIVPSARTQTIQEAHILIGHSLCEAVENLT